MPYEAVADDPHATAKSDILGVLKCEGYVVTEGVKNALDDFMEAVSDEQPEG